MSEPVITLQGFLSRFLAQHEERTDHPFCFILGAGASKPSGIPTGGELARRWVEEMWKEEEFRKLPLQEWATEKRLGIKGFSLERCGDFYPSIYDRRFQDDPETGYAFLEREMDGKEPSFGYAVLAFLMSETAHRIVITTNFDNLMGDSLSIHSRKFPLVIGHDALANYASVAPRRPLVAKIHGAVGFAPKNTENEVGVLSPEWRKSLEGVLRGCTPIVIGYAGNDGSLMGFLESLPAGVPNRVYWLVQSGEVDPAKVWESISPRIRDFVSKKNGNVVPIPGFDEVMLLLYDHIRKPLEIPDLYERLQKRARNRENHFDEQIKDLRERLREKPTPVAPTPGEKPPIGTGSEEVQTLLQGAAGRLATLRPEKPWWEWENEASTETDLARRDEIYQEALKELPASAPLLSNYANFLSDQRKDFDRAEEFYCRAIDANPKQATILGNYAVFLSDQRRDFDRAEKFYRRAIEADPKDAIRLGNYAIFLLYKRKEIDRADEFFRRVIEADPKLANNLGAYAFLLRQRKNFDRAEEFYRRAIEADPKHANSLGAYAIFLSDERKDFDRAEEFYRRAIDADPKHANGLGNYAKLILAQGRIKEGLEFVSRAEKTEGKPPGLQVELLFYRAAHDQSAWPMVLRRMKSVLESGERSPGWNLEENILRAEKDHHPNPALLRALARVISDGADVSTLSAFPEWVKAIQGS